MLPSQQEALLAVHTKRATWGIDLQAFAAFLQARDPASEKLEPHLEDLHLTYGAAQGCEAAVHAVVMHLRSLGLSHKKARVSDETLEEARQNLLERLLVPRTGKAPQIGSYDGKGPLEGWLRVSLAREAIYLHERNDTHTPWNAWEELLALPDHGASPEAALAKATYRDQYKKAFEHSVATLGTRERAVLRQHLLLGLSIDHIGDLYSVHRATAARWVNDARETVLARMRENLKTQLGVSHAELGRIAALVESRLDFSLHRVLRSTHGK